MGCNSPAIPVTVNRFVARLARRSDGLAAGVRAAGSPLILSSRRGNGPWMKGNQHDNRARGSGFLARGGTSVSCAARTFAAPSNYGCFGGLAAMGQAPSIAWAETVASVEADQPQASGEVEPNAAATEPNTSAAASAGGATAPAGTSASAAADGAASPSGGPEDAAAPANSVPSASASGDASAGDGAAGESGKAAAAAAPGDLAEASTGSLAATDAETLPFRSR